MTTPSILNPYLDLFNKLSECEDPELLKTLRRKVIWSYAWAIPNIEAIEAIREFSPILELGTGTGYWAWLLRQAGSQVVALDQNAGAPPHWSEVIQGEVDRISEFPDHTLMLCWPPDRSTMASECLEKYRGRFLIFIGEQKSGATGDALFHDRLARDFTMIKEIPVPRWPQCLDSVFIFERNSS